MSKKGNLDSIFNPKSVAIAGVSTGNYGQMLLDNVLGYGFRGKVYPLNPKGEEISGLKVYANIRDILESVDYVISCIPAVLVSQLIKDCIIKGVKVVSLYAAGFSESGSREGRELEIELWSLGSCEDWQLALKAQRKCYEAGLPVYHSITSAAKAIDRFLRYHENRSDKGNWLWEEAF